MIKNAFFLFIVIGLSLQVSAQRIFRDEAYGFSMQEPKDWVLMDKQAVIANINKTISTDEKVLHEAIKNSSGALLMASFAKYEANKHAGLIPTIKINVLANPTQNFEQFNQVVAYNSNSFKNYFPDFVLIKKPEIIEVNGNKGIVFIGTYSLKTTAGGVMKVRTRTYAFPNGKYFFQLNFTDEQGNDADSKLFDDLVQTIKIGK